MNAGCLSGMGALRCRQGGGGGWGYVATCAGTPSWNMGGVAGGCIASAADSVPADVEEVPFGGIWEGGAWRSKVPYLAASLTTWEGGTGTYLQLIMASDLIDMVGGCLEGMALWETWSIWEEEGTYGMSIAGETCLGEGMEGGLLASVSINLEACELQPSRSAACILSWWSVSNEPSSLWEASITYRHVASATILLGRTITPAGRVGREEEPSS